MLVFNGHRYGVFREAVMTKRARKREKAGMEMNRITAKEALERCGCDSELNLIDERIRAECDRGLRQVCLAVDMPVEWTADVIASLRGRGFTVSKLQNPTRTKVSW